MPTFEEEVLSLAKERQAGAPDAKGESEPKLPKTITSRSQAKQQPFITGDFAKSVTPSLHKPAPEFEDDIMKQVEKRVLGYSRAEGQVKIDPKTIEAINSIDEKKLEQEILQMAAGIKDPARIKGNDAKSGSGALGIVGDVLSAEENFIVSKINKVMGFKEKSNFTDYTYTQLLLDMGAPDNGWTQGAGLALSIFGTPSTYTTFGVGSGVKIAGKVAGKSTVITLSKSGKQLRDQVVKRRLDQRLKQEVAQFGEESAKKSQSRIARAETKKVDQELTEKFFELQTGISPKNLSKDIANVSDSVFDLGGMKFFGKQVVKGKTVAKEFEKVHKAIEGTMEGMAIRSKPAQDFLTEVRQSKDMLGKMFIDKFGVEKELLDSWDRAEKLSRIVEGRTERWAKGFFRGLNTDQQREFAEASIQASKKSGQQKEAVVQELKIRLKRDPTNDELQEVIRVVREKNPVKSKDPKVQELLDKFHGQGKFSNKESVSKRLARWSALAEEKELPVWFPGVSKYVEGVRLKLPRDGGKSLREFLKARRTDRDFSKIYTRDPVKAITQRRIAVAFANIQDNLFENIVRTKQGGMLTHDEWVNLGKIDPAKQSRFVELRPPIQMLSRFSNKRINTKDKVFVESKFASSYNKLIRDQTFRIPVLSYATNLFKAGVTSPFPGFHVRNFMSNIVLNSMKIGGHSVNPKNINLAFSAVRNKNLNQVVVTDVGQKIKLGDLLEEARTEGVISDMFMDIGGETLSKIDQDFLHRMYTTANPLSTQFAPFVWGKKFGSQLENHSRLVNYIFQRKRGLSPRLAKIEVNEALFDYQAITGFEKNVANLVIPFYTFSRKNIEAHAKLFAYRPGAVAAQLKFFRDTGPTDQEWENELPEWTKRRYVARVYGTLTAGYAFPIEDIMQNIGSDKREVLTRLNPIFRFYLEKGIDQDIFSGRRLSAMNSAQEFRPLLEMATNKNIPKSLRQPFIRAAKLLKLERDPTKPNKIIGDPDKLHILRSSFTSRFASLIGQLNNEEKDAMRTTIRLLTGIYVVPKNAQRSLSAAKRKLNKQLIKKIESTNTNKIMDAPFPVQRSKFERKFITRMFQDMKKTGANSELNQVFKELDDQLEQEQQSRIESQFK